MWLPSPCSSSVKSRSQNRQVSQMEAGIWTTHWMVHRATEHGSPERRRMLSYHERTLFFSLDHVWKTRCDFSLTLRPGHARILIKGRWSNNQLTRCMRRNNWFEPSLFSDDIGKRSEDFSPSQLLVRLSCYVEVGGLRVPWSYGKRHVLFRRQRIFGWKIGKRKLGDYDRCADSAG